MTRNTIRTAIVNFAQVLGTSAPDTDPCGMFSSYGKARGWNLPSRGGSAGVGGVGSVGAANSTRVPGMMGRGRTFWGMGVGVVGVLRRERAATNQPIQAQLKSSRFGGVGMCASSAAFSRSVLAAAATFSAALAAPAMAQSFPFGLNLYSAPEGQTQSLFAGVHLAKDGSAVAATYSNGAVRFTPAGTLSYPSPGSAFDISDGGTHIVDYHTRRSLSGQIDQILPASTRVLAGDFKPRISGDGATVAGSTEVISSNMVVGSRAYRWTEAGGLQNLPDYRPGAIFTSVGGLSQDGTTIVGVGRTEFFGDDDAWKWTEQSGYTILPTLPDALSPYAKANAVNNDGSIIVGQGHAPVVGTWTLVWRGEQVTPLPPLPGYRSSTAYDLSDDGSVITGANGFSAIGLPQIQTIWTEDTGWIPALDYFRLQGVEIPSYILAAGPADVSADGRTFSMQVFDSRTSEYLISVIVVPSPSVLPAIGMAFLFSRRARARRIG